MPTAPWVKKENKPKTKFYAKDEPLPLLLSLLMGLQHAFAMVGGLITPVSVYFGLHRLFNLEFGRHKI